MRFPFFPLKIGLAVFVPVLAALLVGLFGASRLTALAERAHELETIRLPRADLAGTVERRLLLAAQAVRNYALSNDREALERAKKELAQAADALHAAREAASRPGMASLGTEAQQIASVLETYKKAAEASVADNERVGTDRAALTEAANTFLTAATAYADWKTAQWDKALAVKYPQPAALRQHAQRLKTIRQAIAIGGEPRLAAETARATRNPALLTAVVPRLDAVETLLRTLKGNDEDNKRMVPVFAALAAYRRAITALITDWATLRATGQRILKAERAALAAGDRLGGGSLTEAASEATNLDTTLSRSRIGLMVVTWGVTVIGLTFAVLAAVVFGMPVRRCAAFARDLSEGRVTETLAEDGRDEVGILAASLREIARRIGKHLAR